MLFIMKKSILLIFMVLACVLTSIDLAANKYAVYFTDKDNTPYSVDNPLEYLSQRALDRRARHGIAITEQDLPVDPAYLQQLVDMGATIKRTSKWLNLAIISCSASVADQIEDLDFVTKVEYVAPGSYKGDSKFADKLKTEIKPYEFTGKEDLDYGAGYNQINQVNGIPVHQEGYDGEGILVAVLDGGFENVDNVPGFDRLYEEGRLVYTENVVNPEISVYSSATGSHGTNVLSCMASWMPGQFIGTAPEASYALLVTEDSASEYPVECYYWVVGAEVADSIGADIISSSLGYQAFDDSSLDFSHEDMDGVTIASSIAATIATEKGIFVTVSAGNSNGTSSPWVTTPSDPVEACCVGAVDASGNIAYFSSIGPNGAGDPKPNILAMGSGTTVLSPSGSISTNSGTSFACPVSAGMISCLIQANPTLYPTELLQILNEVGDRYPNHSNTYGYGIPDYEEALEMVLERVDLQLDNYVINEIEGNGDGLLNPGEIASVDVVVYNISENDIENIEVQFSAIEDIYTLSSEGAVIPNLPAGGEYTLQNAFTIQLSEEAIPATNAKIGVNMTHDNGMVISKLEMTIYGHNVAYDGVVIVNDDNENGILEPGETADMLVYLANEGNIEAQDIRATLSSSSEYVTINDDEKLYGNLQPNMSRYAIFNITLAEDVSVKDVLIPFTLNLVGEDIEQSINFEYKDVCNLVFNLYDSYGDGWNNAHLVVEFSDGSPNESFTIPSSNDFATFTVEVVSGVTVTLVWQSGMYDSECSFEVLYETGELIYESGNLHPGDLFSFEVACSGSSQNVCMPPTDLAATSGNDYVSLTWIAPVDAEPLSYNVYRDNEFIANVTETEYTDTALPEDLYCYAIEGVYHHCMSGFSNEVCIDVFQSDLMGDANNDSNVDVNDVMTVVNYILEKDPYPFVLENADVNADGVVDVRDIFNIVNIIFR